MRGAESARTRALAITLVAADETVAIAVCAGDLA